MKIDAIKMVREARDRISRETWGMSNAEIIEYHRKGAQKCLARMEEEAPGREARLKAMGLSSNPGEVPTVKIPSEASKKPMAAGSSVSGSSEAAPAVAAVSAKSGSEID